MIFLLMLKYLSNIYQVLLSLLQFHLIPPGLNTFFLFNINWNFTSKKSTSLKNKTKNCFCYLLYVFQYISVNLLKNGKKNKKTKEKQTNKKNKQTKNNKKTTTTTKNQQQHHLKTKQKCDMIKGNESDVGNNWFWVTG